MKYRMQYLSGLGAMGLMLLIAAAPVAAITIDEVIKLSEAGASDSVIMSKIDDDGTVFHPTVDDILLLKEKGVSDVVITYMMNSGKVDQQDKVQEASPEDEAGPPADGKAENDNYDDGGGGDVSVGLGFDSYGNVGFSFGYYYPHWPGYWYSYYYDPFWWPSWCYYWGYYAPYPYYYWYYDPWYACNGYYHGYYDNCYYDHYHNDGYNYGYNDGRNVGNRGPSNGYDRTIKNPTTGKPGTNAVQAARQSTRLKDPNGIAMANNLRSPVRNTIKRPNSPRANNNMISYPNRTRVRTPENYRSPQYTRGGTRRSYVRTQPARSHMRSAPGRNYVQTEPGRGEEVQVYRSQPSRGEAAPPSRSAPPERSAPAREWGGQGRGSAPSHGGAGFGGGGFRGGNSGGGFHGGGGGGGGGGRGGRH